MPAKARVTVTLDIDASSTWGDDCTVGQIKKQALDDANMKLTKALGSQTDIKIIGKFKCVSINYTE